MSDHSDHYTFVTKVVGVSFQNDDGSDRQAIIEQHVKPGKALYLYHEPSEYSETAVSVYISTGPRPDQIAQIGHIADTTTQKYNFWKRVADGKVTGQVVDVVKGEGKTTGVIVGIITEDLSASNPIPTKTVTVDITKKKAKSPHRARNYLVAIAVSILLVCLCLVLLVALA